jgi:hypothetical protein
LIHQALHREPVVLDREAHRALKVRPGAPDWSVAERLNAYFAHAVEFADLCKEFPLVFMRAGQDAAGKPLVAPMAVFGLADAENLFVEDGRWLADYMPSMLRTYPFATARVDDERHAVCIDRGAPVWSETEGTPLFEPDGQPSALLRDMQGVLDRLEGEMARTRAACDRLLAHDLLAEKRFDATLPDGQKLSVGGFLAVDETKLAALGDAAVLELYRSGVLALITLHQISLGNMARLAERRRRRAAAA